MLVGTLVGVGGAVGGGGVLLGLPQPPVPSFVNGALQIMLGMLVGFKMSRDSLGSGARALVPAALLAAIVVPTAVVVALIIAPLTSINVVTALFAAAPGGMTEMSTVSASFGADGAAVAAIQLVRVLLAVAIANAVLARLRPKDKPDHQEERDAEETGYAEDLKRLGLAIPWGVLGGLLGVLSSAPAGGILGALVGSAAFRLLTGRPVPEAKFRLGVQALAGGVIGLGVSGEFFGQIVRLAGAGALIISAQMLLWLATCWLLVKLFRYDLATAALASAPGGMSEIVSTAGGAGADEVVVTFVHLVRLSTIVIVVPVLVALFFGR